MMTVGLWSRRMGRLTANPSRAIYGTIVATALIAATSAYDNNPGHIARATIATLLVFWLAHAYSQVLEHGLRHRRFHRSVIRDALSEEFALVEGPALAIVLLVLGALGWIGGGLAIDLALANGVVQLMVWGTAVGRRFDRSWPVAVAVGLLNAAVGGVVILLKALLH